MGPEALIGLKTDGTCIVLGDNAEGQLNELWPKVIDITAVLSYGELVTIGIASDKYLVLADWGKNLFMNPISGGDSAYEWDGVIKIDSYILEYGEYIIVGLKEDGTALFQAAISEEGEEDTIENWENLIAVSHGLQHFVGLLADGTTVIAGCNDYEQCETDNWMNIIQVECGDRITVGLTSEGTVIVAGENYDDYKYDISKWKDIVAIDVCGGVIVGVKADGTIVSNASIDEIDLDMWE